MSHGFFCGSRINKFEGSLSTILASFLVDWEIHFADATVEAEYVLEVYNKNISRQIGNNNDFGR